MTEKKKLDKWCLDCHNGGSAVSCTDCMLKIIVGDKQIKRPPHFTERPPVSDEYELNSDHVW